MHKQEIVALLHDNRAQLYNFGVAKLGLFGSFVRNEQHADSDVDLLVEFQPDQKSFDNFMHLFFFLEELLKRPVELITPESLSPYLGPKIMNTVEYVIASN